MKSQAASRKLPIMSYKYPQLRYGTNRRHKPSTPPQQLPTNRYENDPTDNDAPYTIYIETLRVKRLYHLNAHFEIVIVGANRRPHRNIQIRRNCTIHINHLIDRPLICPPCSPPGMNSSTSPMNGIVKQNGDTIGRRHSYRLRSDNRSSRHRHRLNKLFVLA